MRILTLLIKLTLKIIITISLALAAMFVLLGLASGED